MTISLHFGRHWRRASVAGRSVHMSNIITKAWRRMVPGRIVLIAMVMLGVSFVLFVFVNSVGDGDLPPYQPEIAVEHLCKVALAAIWWPGIAATWALHRDTAITLPLSYLGAVFWAVLFEFLLTAKNARRT